MLSASSLLLTFTVFLFYEGSTLRDGFIYSKEIPLSQEIIHFSLKDSEKLVGQAYKKKIQIYQTVLVNRAWIETVA